MAEKTPLKYEAGTHTPFAPGDTIPASVLDLASKIQAGPGIQVTPNPDGTITVSNLCCDEPCVPDWQDTGTTRCIGEFQENFQEDGCGNSRWFETTIPCEEPCVPDWQNTGTTRCTGAFLENFQEDGCGNSRWEATATPSWSDTGTTRCSGTNIENQQINACDGTTRWVDSGTPVVWTDSGEAFCDGGTLRQPQVNQCGDTRDFDTGVACSEEPDLSWTRGAYGCHARQGMLEGEYLESFIHVNADGTGSSGTSGGPAPSGVWLPAGATASDFEVRVDAGGAACTPYSGTLGVWLALNTNRSFVWRATATGPGSQQVCQFQGTLRMRRIGETDEVTRQVDLELHANGQCF